MDTTAPVIICPSNPDRPRSYPLADLSEVYVFGYQLSPAMWVAVLCPCGRWHNLQPGQLVQDALALGFPYVSCGECPPLEHVFDVLGLEGLPLRLESDRPLSPSDEARLAAFQTGLGTALDELLLPTAEAAVAEFSAQLADLGPRGLMRALFEATDTEPDSAPDDDVGPLAA
jgi:hypothetical protein